MLRPDVLRFPRSAGCGLPQLHYTPREGSLPERLENSHDSGLVRLVDSGRGKEILRIPTRNAR
jgi:hypothetical protein